MSLASARPCARSGCGAATAMRAASSPAPPGSPAAPSLLNSTMSSPPCMRHSRPWRSGVGDPKKGAVLSFHASEARKRQMVAKHVQLVGHGQVQQRAPAERGLVSVHVGGRAPIGMGEGNVIVLYGVGGDEKPAVAG